MSVNEEKSCNDCISFKVCHAVRLTSKMDHADILCKYFIDKDTINRQKAEIERLQEIIAMRNFTSLTAMKAAENWHRMNSERIKRLEEEVEMLMNPTLEINNVALSEDEIMKLIGNSPVQIIPCNEEHIKSEAGKELLEKLIKEYGDYTLDTKISIGIIFCSIKRIVREMVGEIDV